jgi:hypothetical protein
MFTLFPVVAFCAAEKRGESARRARDRDIGIDIRPILQWGERERGKRGEERRESVHIQSNRESNRDRDTHRERERRGERQRYPQRDIPTHTHREREREIERSRESLREREREIKQGKCLSSLSTHSLSLFLTLSNDFHKHTVKPHREREREKSTETLSTVQIILSQRFVLLQRNHLYFSIVTSFAFLSNNGAITYNSEEMVDAGTAPPARIL